MTEPDTIRSMALYNGLVRLANSGRDVEMDLAEEVSSTPDAKLWTVRLRPGLTFHNGAPVTPQDVFADVQTYDALKIVLTLTP